MSAEQNFRQSLGEFYKKNYCPLFRFAVSQTPTHEEAQEVFQDAFTEALNSLSCFDQTRWKSWFFMRIKSRAQDRARRRANSPVVSLGSKVRDGDTDPIENALDKLPLPNEILERVELGQQLQQALGLLKNAQQRRVLELFYFDLENCPTLKDVADAMSISPENAKKLHQRAKNTLKLSLRKLAQQLNILTDRPDHES